MGGYGVNLANFKLLVVGQEHSTAAHYTFSMSAELVCQVLTPPSTMVPSVSMLRFGEEDSYQCADPSQCLRLLL